MALVAVLLLFNLIFADSPPELGAMHTIQHIILPYLASCFLLLPTIVNLVLVFVWKHSSNTENTIRGRCHWDIDVVWSGVGDHCSSYTSWPAWLLGAVFRLLFTAGFLASPLTLRSFHTTNLSMLGCVSRTKSPPKDSSRPTTQRKSIYTLSFPTQAPPSRFFTGCHPGCRKRSNGLCGSQHD